MGVKLLLSSLPVPYDFWSRINLFRHGQMDNAAYALACFETHWRATENATTPPRTILELGPGDSLLTALIAYTRGVSCTYMVDSGPYASRSIEIYQRAREHLQKVRSDASLPQFASIEEMLAKTGGRYLTEGTTSLRSIPSASVDLVYSHATLEHVPLRQIEEQLEQTRRILRPDGVVSHQVDLRDHLGGGLNNLRFSEAFWETPRIHRSGFYTNRVRLPTYLRMFRDHGLEVRELDVRRWPGLPLRRGSLDPSFRHFNDSDLCVSGFRAVLTLAR
jgi:SAM-dependent methyltransferase